MHSNNYKDNLRSERTQEAPPSNFSKKLRNVKNSESDESDEIVNYEVI